MGPFSGIDGKEWMVTVIYIEGNYEYNCIEYNCEYNCNQRSRFEVINEINVVDGVS